MDGVSEVDGPWWNEAAVRMLGDLLRAWGADLGPLPRPGPRFELVPLVDVREAARRLTRRRDLVDACVEVTLREPTWLT